MVYLEVHNSTDGTLEEFTQLMARKDGDVYLLLYMEGCMPCKVTREEWVKLPHMSSPRIHIVMVNKDLFGNVSGLGSEPEGFPTIRHLSWNPTTITPYEGSERTVDAFAEWIERTSHKSGGSTHKRNQKSQTKHRNRNRNRTRNKKHTKHTTHKKKKHLTKRVFTKRG